MLKFRKMEIIYRQSKKAKRISIKIDFLGKVEVVYPVLVPKFLAKKFAQQKKDWIAKQLTKISRKEINPVLAINSREHFLLHKDQAFALVKERVEFWNQKYGFTYNQIRVKKMKIWGSCSSRQNLNFNYKIIFLAPQAADYIVVHELCHLAEMNHSAKFWQLVQKEIPNAREIQRNIGALA